MVEIKNTAGPGGPTEVETPTPIEQRLPLQDTDDLDEAILGVTGGDPLGTPRALNQGAQLVDELSPTDMSVERAVAADMRKSVIDEFEVANVDEDAWLTGDNVKDFVANIPDYIWAGMRATPSNLIDVAPGVVRGGIKGTENAINTLLTMAEMFNPPGNLGQFHPGMTGVAPIGMFMFGQELGMETVRKGMGLSDIEPKALEKSMPKVDFSSFTPEERETFLGEASDVLTQFLVGFVPLIKAAKSAQALQGLKHGSEIVSAALAATGAGFLTVDDSLDTAAANLVEMFPSLKNPVMEFLATNEDDSVAERKFKHALNEGLLGTAGDLVFAGFSVLRQAYKARYNKGLPKLITEETDVPEERLKLVFGDPGDEAETVTLVDLARMAKEDQYGKQADAFIDERLPRIEGEVDIHVEADAILRYQESSVDVNKTLGSLYDNDITALDEDALTLLHGELDAQEFVDTVRGLDAATARHTFAAADTLYHGGTINTDVLIAIDAGETFEFMDPSFLSTTRDPGIAATYAAKDAKRGRHGTRKGEHSVIWEIEVPAGQKHYDYSTQELGGTFERIILDDEILLPRGMVFEAYEVYDEAGQTIVKMRAKEQITDPDTLISFQHAGDPPQMALNINLRRLNTTEDVRRTIDEVANLLDSDFAALRKQYGDLDENTVADILDIPVAEVIKQAGGLEKQAIAVRALLDASGRNLLALARRAATSTDDLDKVAFRRAFNVHAAIQAEAHGRAALAGRLLRSYSIPVGDNKTVVKHLAALSQQGDGRQLTQRMAAFVEQMTPEELLNAGRLDAEFSKEQSLTAKSFDIFLEWWINGLLSAPTTHLVNTLSNSATALWSIPEGFIARAAAEGFTQAGIGSAGRIFGLMQGVNDGLRLVGRLLMGKEENFAGFAGKIDIQPFGGKIATEKSGPIGMAINTLGKVIRIPTGALLTEDVFFKAIAYRMKVAEQAALTAYGNGARGIDFVHQARNVMKDPPGNIRLSAVNEADYLTFTNPTGKYAAAFLTARNAHPIMKVFFPFVNTPANILSYTFQRTPLAPLTAQYRNAIAKGGIDAATARTRMWMGTLTMAGFANLSVQGLVTGGGPADPGLRRVWLENHEPYSIRVGNTWVQYSRLDPLGFLIGFAADFAAISGYLDNEMAAEAVAMNTMAALGNFTDSTYLAGLGFVSEFIAAGSTAPALDFKTLQESLKQLGSSFIVPRIVAQAERALDPTQRTDDARSFTMAFMDTIKAQIPGYSDKLPADHDIWGNPIIMNAGYGPDNIGLLYRFVVPFQASPVEVDPVSKALYDNQIGVAFPQRTVQGVRLTEEEYQFLKVVRGKTARKAVEKIVKSSDWKTAPRHLREAMVRSAFAEATSLAVARLVEHTASKGRYSLQYRIEQKLQNDRDIEVPR